MNIFDVQKISQGWVFDYQAHFAPPVMQGELEALGVGTHRFTVRWQPATAAVGGIAGYQVSANDGPYMPAGMDSSYRFTWMAASSSHTIRVRAYDEMRHYSAPLAIVVTTNPQPTATVGRVLINGRVGDTSTVAVIAAFPKN